MNPPAADALHTRMRRLLTAAFLALALPALAGDLLDRLADDDPAVREKARQELRGVPAAELEAMQRAAKDAEAAAALREEAERRRVAPVADRADALAKRLAARAATDKDILAMDAFAIPVLLHWLDRTEEVPNMFYSGSCYVDFTPITLDLAARTWLQVLTGEREAASADEWKRRAAAWRGRPLAELALDGLTKRGYRVRAGEPEEAAGALVEAFEKESAKGWPSPLNQWQVGGMAYAARWLLEARMGEEVRTRDPFAPKAAESAPYREWLAANRGSVTWDGRRFGTKAAPADWIKILAGDDRDAIAGALRLLAPHAGAAAPAARRHLEAHPVAVARLMGKAGVAATAAELRVLLAAMRYDALGGDTRGTLTGDALADLVRSKPDTDVLTIALYALSEVGSPRHAALALEFAVSAEHTSGDPADWLNGRAAQAVAALGDDAQVQKILPWLKASNPFVRTEVAWPLLRRGRPEAWPAVADALASGRLSPSTVSARLHDVVPDLPLGDDPAAWTAWARDTKSLRWDAAAKRWSK